MTMRRCWLAPVLFAAMSCSGAPDPGEPRTLLQGLQISEDAHYLEVGGSVVIEAEDYSAATAVGALEWTPLSDSGASGSEGMTTPDLGEHGEWNSPLPQLDYRVGFTTLGTYDVWVRGRALPGALRGSSDSVHLGLDGVFETADRISNFGDGWTWRSVTMDGPHATLNVTSGGVHTLNVKMREDGFSIDKIYLLTPGGSPPSGFGPTVSPLSAPAFVEHGGIAVFEAEHYVDQLSGADDTWTPIADALASGGAALQALPDDGTGFASAQDAARRAPEVRFPVTFSEPGSYLVWVRGKAGGTSRDTSDSVHLGIDGAVSSDYVYGFADSYCWRNDTPRGPATIEVAAAGVHVIEAYVREDGFVLDKIVMMREGVGTPPTDTGPNETLDTGDPCADELRNGDETDTDCGGTKCDGCLIGEHCVVDSDCAAGLCVGVCAWDPRCGDGIWNGDETGLDCGGSCPACEARHAPFLESGDRVVIEAESFSTRISSPGEAAWVLASDPDASGQLYLEATPDAGKNYDPPTSITARVDYPVYLEKVGYYWVYLRGSAAAGSRTQSDSVTIGLDGAPVSTVATYKEFWGWRRKSSSAGGYVAIDVAEPGLHSVNVWIREDGFKFDKAILVRDKYAYYSDLGPAESSRSECPLGPGYSGDPCTDIDECALGTDSCDEHATCVNEPGSYGCVCNTGYTGDGITCEPIPLDECAEGLSECDEHATCTDLPDGYDCSCNAGYDGDGWTCTLALVNECSGYTDYCNVNATCHDLPVGFECICDPGYVGDGFACITGCVPGTVCCGDGSVMGAEICDDGNTAAGDGCRADCRGWEICGDGLIDSLTGEECDDGNTVDGDGCSSTCTLAPYATQPAQAINGLMTSCGLGDGALGRRTAVDQIGNLYVLMSCDGENYASSSTDRGLTWNPPVNTGLSGYQAAIEGGPPGIAYVVAAAGGELVFSRTLDAGATWENPTTLAASSGWAPSMDASGESVYIALGSNSDWREVDVYRNHARGAGPFAVSHVNGTDSLEPWQREEYPETRHEVVVDRITGDVVVISPAFWGYLFMSRSSDSGASFWTPSWLDLVGDAAGSNGLLYSVEGFVGVDVVSIPSPGTRFEALGLPATDYWPAQSLDVDALGNAYVLTHVVPPDDLEPPPEVVLDRLPRGATAVPVEDHRVLAATSRIGSTSIAALPTNDGALVAWCESAGLVQVALEVY